MHLGVRDLQPATHGGNKGFKPAHASLAGAHCWCRDKQNLNKGMVSTGTQDSVPTTKHAAN